MGEKQLERAVCETREFGDWLVMIDISTGDFSVAELGPKPNRRQRRAAIAWTHRTLNEHGFQTSLNQVWLMFQD
jgi:hypothetical protein